MTRPLLFLRASTIWALLGSVPTLAAETTDKDEPAEQALEQADVPKAVIDAVSKKYPKAQLKKFQKEQDGGKTVFEVELASGKDEVSVNVSPEGRILDEEILIKAGALPPQVKAGLDASKYKGWRISKIERVIHRENENAPEYEMLVTSRKQRFEVVLDKDGKITKEEAKSGKDTD
jgi:hypothetical protein